ncbi:hypothetical protein GQ600_7909 [Phytophthora cactorum]|nr:hypothetical protein GQ600_7909 [Phytophthora cactorum]
MLCAVKQRWIWRYQSSNVHRDIELRSRADLPPFKFHTQACSREVIGRMIKLSTLVMQELVEQNR